MNDTEIQELFVNNSCAVMLRFDTDGIITYLNNFGCEFFGYAPEEVMGKHILDTIAPRTDSSGRGLEEMFQRFNEFPHEFATNYNENMKKDGTRVLFAWRNCAEFDDEGWVKGFVSVGIDITNTQNEALVLREENTFLKSTLNAFDTAFFITDKEGKLKGYNRPFKKLFPESVPAFEQRNVMQLIETIACALGDEEGEAFREDAGAALANPGSAPASGSFVLRGNEQVSWQARPRTAGGGFQGLLWIFRQGSV